MVTCPLGFMMGVGEGMSNNLLWMTVVGALLATAGQSSAEDLVWFSNQYDSTTTLAYGMPDTDYTPIVFNCEKGDETARLFVTHDAPNAEDGQQFDVTLSSAAGSVQLLATGQFQEIDDLLHLEGQVPLDQKLVRILSSGDTLKISMGADVQEIPLTGAADEVDALVAACGAPLSQNDLEFKITNRTDTPIVSFLFSEHGVNDFDGDAYGNYVLSPGESTYLTIRDGKPACVFDLRAEFDEDAERDPFDGMQNLCNDDEFLVTAK